MTDIINLRRVRKAKARRSAEAEAQARRLVFGRTKSERQATEREHDRALRLIEGHRRPSQAREETEAGELPDRFLRDD